MKDSSLKTKRVSCSITSSTSSVEWGKMITRKWARSLAMRSISKRNYRPTLMLHYLNSSSLSMKKLKITTMRAVMRRIAATRNTSKDPARVKNMKVLRSLTIQTTMRWSSTKKITRTGGWRPKEARDLNKIKRHDEWRIRGTTSD